MISDASENPKRFYANAEVQAIGAGFALSLDGRIARTPGGRSIELPTRALADLVAREWSAQVMTIAFTTMPLTRLAFTAIDVVAVEPAEARATIVGYAGADLLCYRAEAPRTLVVQQEAAWSPILAWAGNSLGLEFRTASGLIHRPQPAATLQRLDILLGEIGVFALAGVAFGSRLFGSAILALALERARLSGEAAFFASRVDETFQQSQWGRDAEAAAAEAVLADDALALERWFRAL